MSSRTLLRTVVGAIAIAQLTGCSTWFAGKEKNVPVAPTATASPAPAPSAPAAAAASLSPAELHGVWECHFQIKMGEDTASFTYTDQFNDDGTLKSQAYLVYDLPSTRQQYSFVLQGTGHWRMQGSSITLIVPEVARQDLSAHKNPDMIKDKDLVPEDLNDTWQIQARQGRNMRVEVGSLADEMLCQKE